MARSHYVYIVHDPFATGKEQLMAGFTVKHECKTFLDRLSPQRRSEVQVYSLPDNRFGLPKIIQFELEETT